MIMSVKEDKSSCLTILDKFSTWKRVLRFAELCLKFKNIACTREPNLKPTIKVENSEQAKRVILRTLQRKVFGDELSILQNRDELPSGNRLLALNPFVDEYGLLRVGGRIKRSSFLYGVKHPLIIPKDSHITQLLVAHYHSISQHQGRSLTMNELRSSGLWIIGCSQVVSSYIHKCVTCRRLRSKAQIQMMSDLPVERLEPSPPFTHCGIDCFGPFTVKDGRKEMKKYGLIVTCLASRAIHIECLDDMTSDCFINSLRCVIAIRGPIRSVRTDQGTNFKGASLELREAMKENIEEPAIREFLLSQHCDFIFNSPSASHMGGIWERQIRSIRSVLDVILYQHSSRPDSSSLRTFLYEVMAIINGRPITLQNMNDPEAPTPLTPNHLLTFKSNVVVPPPGHFDREDIYSRKRWRCVQGITNEFWQRWKKEFVLTLQSRQKWHKTNRNVQVGDVMLLKDDDLPRNCWKLGRVCELIPAKDERIRRVKLMIGDSCLNHDGTRTKELSILERPIHKLILIFENVPDV